jgi:hypothetical protein
VLVAVFLPYIIRLAILIVPLIAIIVVALAVAAKAGGVP